MRYRTRTACGTLATALLIAAAAAQPAPAQLFADCLVSGGGRIVAANGDPATFGGSASNLRPQLGHELYVDHGPATPLRFRSIVMTAVLCNADAREADLVGTGTVRLPSGEEEVVQHLIRVRDLGERPSAPPDTYRITLSNGYDSGEQIVERGNIQMLFP